MQNKEKIEHKSELDLILDITAQLKKLEQRVDILNHNFTQKVKNLDDDDVKIFQQAAQTDIIAKTILECLMDNEIITPEQINEISTRCIGQDIVKKKTNH